MRKADVAIVGAGMAGASLAAELAGRASVLLLEAEDQPGYHSTGRSAAFWSETYGGPQVGPLTVASRADLEAGGFLRPRGALHVAEEACRPALDRLVAAFERSGVPLEPLGRDGIEAHLPGVRPAWIAGLWEPTCADIDVAGLHAAFLAAARRAGAELVTQGRLRSAERRPGGWRLQTEAGEMEATILVNAAGAWADDVARAAGEPPLGIVPYRRTLAQLRIDPAAPPDLPLVIDAEGRFYFKPEAGGRLWLSPHDETPCAAGDCAPEEIDVAIAIERLGALMPWRVERVERRWAGLRSFAPDRLPVYGYAPGRRDFFWCAGQGGFGIQTAPAAAKLAAALLLGTAPDPEVAAIDPEPYRPERLGN